MELERISNTGWTSPKARVKRSVAQITIGCHQHRYPITKSPANKRTNSHYIDVIDCAQKKSWRSSLVYVKKRKYEIQFQISYLSQVVSSDNWFPRFNYPGLCSARETGDIYTFYIYIYQKHSTLLHFRQLNFYEFHRSVDQINQTFNLFMLNFYILIKIVLYI